jgi:hypothetical protein
MNLGPPTEVNSHDGTKRKVMTEPKEIWGLERRIDEVRDFIRRLETPHRGDEEATDREDLLSASKTILRGLEDAVFRQMETRILINDDLD